MKIVVLECFTRFSSCHTLRKQLSLVAALVQTSYSFLLQFCAFSMRCVLCALNRFALFLQISCLCALKRSAQGASIGSNTTDLVFSIHRFESVPRPMLDVKALCGLIFFFLVFVIFEKMPADFVLSKRSLCASLHWTRHACVHTTMFFSIMSQ